MAVWQWIGGIAGQHLIPCILASTVLHLWLLVLFGPVRIRSAGIRVGLLYLAFLKAALALWVGSAVSCLSDSRFYGYFVVQFPNALPDGLPFAPLPLFAALQRSSWSTWVLVAGLLTFVVALGYRWARLAPFCRAISASLRVGREELPQTFRLFDELVSKTYKTRSWLPRPRLMIVRDAIAPPFTMGVRPPIVVLSADLVRGLGRRELGGVLAHELGHVRRCDYIGRWVATILRDIMVWNPLAHVWYERLIAEQERASDESAARLLGDPVAVASGLVEVAAQSRQLPMVSIGPLGAWRGGKARHHLDARLQSLGSLLPWESPPRNRPLSAAVAWLALPAFLAAQPRVAVCLPKIGEALGSVL